MLHTSPASTPDGVENMRRSNFSVELTADQLRTLEVESARLTNMGIKANSQQVMRILIEQHRLKLRLTAEQDNVPDMLVWLWRKKHDEAE